MNLQNRAIRYASCLAITALICALGTKKSITDEFPNSTNTVISFAKTAITNFEKELTAFKHQPMQDLSYTSTVTSWEDMVRPFFYKAITLSFLSLTTQDQNVIASANTEVEKMQLTLISAIKDPEVLPLFLQFAKDPKNQEDLTAYQAYCLYHILQHINDTPLQGEVESVTQSLATHAMQTFLYQPGACKEKKLPESREVTLLCWNVCLFEGNLSMLFGGVRPWKNRIEAIVDKICELDPDLLCLQEVFSPKCSEILIHKLQSKYAHFYYDMGPNPSGFSIKTLGIPGGLFVASKYPLNDARFVAYTEEETPSYRSYGFFLADIYDDQEPLARLINLHLQPGSEQTDKIYRSKQCQSVLSSLTKQGVPTFLCGDFNIDINSVEALELFHPYQPSQYSGSDWTCCELRDYWWKAQQNTKTFNQLSLDKEWLDYFFYLKDSSNAPPKVATSVIVVNDLNHPQKALSDHQLLYTKITLGKD